jgi:hypothetical protein
MRASKKIINLLFTQNSFNQTSRPDCKFLKKIALLSEANLIDVGPLYVDVVVVVRTRNCPKLPNKITAS